MNDSPGQEFASLDAVCQAVRTEPFSVIDWQEYSEDSFLGSIQPAIVPALHRDQPSLAFRSIDQG